MRILDPNGVMWPGSLVEVALEDVMPEQLSVKAVLPTRHQVPRRVEVFLEVLVQALNEA